MQLKICRVCKIEKPFSDFAKKSASKDGFDYRCKLCMREYNRKWISQNPENRKEATRKYNKTHGEKKKHYARNYYKTSPHIKLALVAKRRATKLQATPMWADLELIELIYEMCPDGMEVDHIVPLQSELVCGFHAWNNLQYLTKAENVSKGNRFWPDMPD